MGEQSRQEKNGHSTERVKVGQTPHGEPTRREVGDSRANKTRSHVAGNKRGPLHVHIIYPCPHVKIVNLFYTCQNSKPFLHMSNIVNPFFTGSL